MVKNTVRIVSIVALSLLAACVGDNGVTQPPAITVVITSVSPTVLSLGVQGQMVEITGSGFVSVTTVDLGAGINIASHEVLDSGRIRVVVNVPKTATPGPRTVTVVAGGVTATLNAGLAVGDNLAPLARFTVSPSQGTVSSIYLFDASESSDEDGSIAGYKWEFSDGSKPQGMKVRHSFTEMGEYTVRLTVTDNKGGTSSAQRLVTVGDNLPPVADFTVTPSTGTNNTIFTFDASVSNDPDGSIESYKWDFGDETSAKGAIVTHKFKEGGSYQVQLTVMDSKKAEATAGKKLSVSFFDEDKARKAIIDTITTFLRLFADFENLTAEQIVIGFSRSDSCTGRAREISIIESEQQLIRSQSVSGISVEVLSVNEKTGRADAYAEFYGITNEGDQYETSATHHFTMVNEDGEWLMCNFTLSK